MLESLRLQNFKRHADTTLALSGLTVIVGPNGSGKTSVLEAIRLLSEALDASDDGADRLLRSLVSMGRHQDDTSIIRVVATGRASGEERHVGVMAGPSERGVAYNDGRLNWGLKISFGRTLEAMEWKPWTDVTNKPLLRSHWPRLRAATMLRLDTRRISEPAIAVERPRVESDGGQLAAVLASLKLADDPSLALIIERLREIIPQFEALRIVPTTVGDRGGYALEFDMDSGKRIRASDISEGTLLVLALLTVLHAPQKPRLLLLDDVHEALHPSAQIALMKYLRTLTDGEDPVQIIATTHSPFIVDAVPQEGVLVFAHRPDGTSAVRPLSEHPDARRYKGALSTGQLWTLDEEQHWVVGSAP